MSYIPDAREKYKTQLYKGTQGAAKEPEPNPYFQGLLNNERKNVLISYDIAVSAMNAMFDHLDIYAEEIQRTLGINTCSGVDVDSEVVNGLCPYPENFDGRNSDKITPGYHVLDDYNSKELHNMTFTTKMFLLFKTILNEWIEVSRNALNTSLIESMDEKEYEKRYNAFIAELEKDKHE